MTKMKKTLLVIMSLSILMGILLPGCKKKNEEPDVPAIQSGDMTYTVQINNANGLPMADVGVYIYEDETMAELVWYDTTGEDGKMSFTNTVADTYVAVLADIPAGYAAEDYYPITGELTQIVLNAAVLDEDAMQNTTLSLGDMMMDFTIVDTDGVEHTLSEILKTKQAVVLNFWYIECNPCCLEFPFLQEAYEKYSDKLEVLALNPVNTDEAAIAAFKKEMKLTFPVAMVDSIWAQMMRLTAYPTTVIIDRYGNISLFHTGYIDNTDTFEQVFNYFTADEYEPVTVGSLEDIVVKDLGSAENPEQKGGDRNFEIAVGAGKTYYFELFKLTTKIYMTVEGEDPFVVTYNGKNYNSKDGSVTITIKPEGPSVLVPITVINKSDKDQIYEVSLDSPKGSYANPYKLKLGEFTAKTKAGDEQGTYYIYTAPKSGTLTVRCLKSNQKKFGFFLYNLNSYAMRNTDEKGPVDENGYIYTSVQVKKGHKIQFNVAVARDDSNNIAAGTFKFEALLIEGSGEEEGKIELPETTYAVTVTDEAGAPLSGISVHFKGSLSYTPPVEEAPPAGDGTETAPNLLADTTGDDATGEETPEEPEIYTQELDQYATTGEDGIASVTGLPGTVTATVRVPEGYKLETAKYTLTEEAPSVTVQLAKIVYKDYTVTVTYPNGDPVSDVLVIVGSGVGYTKENGSVTFSLEEGAYTALILGTPEEYVLNQTAYEMDADNAELTVALSYGLGHETNPIVLRDVLSIDTGELAVGEKICYTIYGVGGSQLSLGDYDAYIVLNGETIQTNPISVQIPEDTDCISLHVGNEGRFTESYTVEFLYPEGHLRNPKPMTSAFTNMLFDVEEGAKEGCYWIKEATGTGTITFSFRSGLSAAENCIVTFSSGDQTVTLTSAEKNPATLPVTKGEPILFHVIAVPDGDTYGALNFRIRGTTEFEAEPEGVAYTVTIQDEAEALQSGVAVQFLKDGTVVKTVMTNASGAAEAVLEAGSYTVAFEDETIICDTSAVVLTEAAPAVTLTISRTEAPVEEGKTRYSVTVVDDAGNLIGDVVVLFMDNGAPVGNAIVGSDGGTVTLDLATGSYNVQLAFLGETDYYYEETTAKVSETDPNLKIRAVTALDTESQEHYFLGMLTPARMGSSYIVTQTDALTFYSFDPTEQGVYQFSVSDPDAVLSYWGQSAYISGDLSNTLKDYTPQRFSVSINTNALGRNIVIGVTGTKNTILTITRMGDAEEDAVYEVYVPKTAPAKYKVSGKPTFTKVDLTASTDTYNLVLNEEDGYYHIGTADGPVMYIQVTFNNQNPDSPVAPSYIHLYDMVGGVGNTGTGFKCIYTDGDGVEHYEDYTQAMLDFGANADTTYGVYPLTEDLKYIIQMGGQHRGWWNPSDENNRLFEDEEGNLDTTVNLEIAWLFAGCYIEGSGKKMMEFPVESELPAGEEIPAEEEIPTKEEVPAEEEPSVEEIPAEEIPVEEEIPTEEEVPVEEEIPTEEEVPVEEEIPAEEEPPIEEEVSTEELEIAE